MENPREIIDDKYQAFIDNDSIHMNYTKLEYVYKTINEQVRDFA